MKRRDAASIQAFTDAHSSKLPCRALRGSEARISQSAEMPEPNLCVRFEPFFAA
jgi:hypothetical protein